VATRLLGRTGRASRFPSSSAFASYAGVAPIEVASADRARHRLPRGGDRQLNLALHIAALTQIRMRASAGRAYYHRKIAEGKTHNQAMRCLKRRLADHVWRIIITDERRKARAAGPEEQPGATLHRDKTTSWDVSLARLSSRFSASSSLILWASAVVVPGSWPVSMRYCLH
jgi:hypothetical protein